MRQVDTIISGGRILLMDQTDTIIPEGSLAIEGDTIIAVGTRQDIAESFTAHKIIPAQGSLVMPGLINAHTHAAMTCFRGIADDLPLMEWLHDYIFPAEAKNVNPELVYWGSLLACAEMIRSGTTTFSDMYLFEDQVAQAAKKAGVRCQIGEGLFDFPSPNAKTPLQGLAYTEMLFEKWCSDPLVSVFVTPHSLYTCSPSILRSAALLAQKYRAPIGIHLLENDAERELIQKKYAKSAIRLLRETGLLECDLIAYHCVALTDEDINTLAQAHCRIVHNAESNMKLASGMAPVSKMLQAGIVLGLGTDGCASNNNLDMFAEMDSAAKLEKVVRLDPTVMPARTVVRMATCNGARVLGYEDIGQLTPGMKADIIIIGLSKPHLTPLYNEYSHLVYTVGGADVDTVIINGQVIMKDRQLTTIDETEVINRVKHLAQGIKNSLARESGLNHPTVVRQSCSAKI